MIGLSTVIPLLLTGVGAGLSCGVSCGACGNPAVNVFFAGYLFTHTDRPKESLATFAGFHIGKAISVSMLCLLISWTGSRIVDENGYIFGFDMRGIVYSVMLFFVSVMIIRWFTENGRKETHCCESSCNKKKRSDSSFGKMLLYGIISGVSPCASMMLILSYASAVNSVEAILVGLSFSLANSVIPMIVLSVLTGLLSEQMHREIPGKIRYFRLATYLIFACVLIKNLSMII